MSLKILAHFGQFYFNFLLLKGNGKKLVYTWVECQKKCFIIFRGLGKGTRSINILNSKI